MKNHFLATVATMLVAVSAAALAHAGTASPETIRNLNAAYQGEANASNRYTQFAAVAESEGYAQAAKLFRAAARAEAIHRDTHKATILELGGALQDVVLEPVTPGITAANLQAAINGESYERDTMYPEFLATARTDNARAAVRSLQFALSAEKEHARLYQAMLDNLATAPATDYYVCTVCGNTTAVLPGDKCPSCRNPADKYVKVS